MATLRFENIYKVYEGDVRAVNDLNLTIDEQDFIVFVGPSGCGKSTTLRMIAGLEEISAGKLYIDDVLVNEVAPKDRDIAMVFQNYALYPHKTVYENMAFGLRQAKMERSAIEERISRAAEILGLTEYLTRKPRALSGGQKQRVALGRAMVREPKVFLLDEPLSNLDAKLRITMRGEITKLHRRLQTTFVYVTHDQVEAMTMGNKIVVMHEGYIQQIDSPTNLYDHPGNIFVATFLGMPQMNILEGTLSEKNGIVTFKILNTNYSFIVANEILRKRVYNADLNAQIIIGVRPEDVYISDKGIPVIIDIIEKRGSELIAQGNIEGTNLPITIKLEGRTNINEGDIVNVMIDEQRLHLFNKKTEKRIADVIDYSYFPGQLDYANKMVSFAGTSFVLGEEDLFKIIPAYRQMSSIGVKIKTNAFSLEKDSEKIALDAVIKEVKYDQKTAVAFIAVEGQDTLVAIKLQASTLEIGQKITLYVNPHDITLYDKDIKNKISATYALYENTTSCIIKNKNGRSYISFGTFNVKLDKHYPDGNYKITIPFDGLTIVDRKTKGNGLMHFYCVNESNLGNNMVLYANLKGFENYVALLAPQDATCFTKKPITFKLEKFSLEKQ